MEWTDEGIILGVRRHGEGSVIAELLTREHGRHLGLVRGGQGPKLRGVFEVGNRLAQRPSFASSDDGYYYLVAAVVVARGEPYDPEAVPQAVAESP